MLCWVNENKIPIALSYQMYKNSVDKYLEFDARELNFQNRVIIPMLEQLLANTDIDVIDTSSLFYRGQHNSRTLDNSQFMTLGCSPPDLVLARNWHIDNVNNKVEYLAAIEIKSPSSKEKICGISFDKYNKHIEKEVTGYLNSKCIDRVILTDCKRWQFFENQYNETEPIDLCDKDNNWKYKTKMDFYELHNDKKEDDNYPCEWIELQNKILCFINKK